jgi:hypothetical protein
MMIDFRSAAAASVSGFRREGQRCATRTLRFLILAIILILSHGGAYGQPGQDIISGIVTDPFDASVPNAKVAIRNTETNATTNATTNETGYYEVRNLNPGPCEARVEVSGFEKFVRSGIDLLADGHPDVDIALKVGSTSETVTVSAGAPLVDTQAVSIGQVITLEEMSSLPNGQAAIWLAMLSPGVQSNFAQNYQLGGADPSWNGAGPNGGSYGHIGANEFSLDGAPNAGNQGGQAINLSPEELGQTSVNITQFDASVGHTYQLPIWAGHFGQRQWSPNYLPDAHDLLESCPSSSTLTGDEKNDQGGTHIE